jgi:hypothetical protein
MEACEHFDLEECRPDPSVSLTIGKSHPKPNATRKDKTGLIINFGADILRPIKVPPKKKGSLNKIHAVVLIMEVKKSFRNLWVITNMSTIKKDCSGKQKRRRIVRIIILRAEL